MVRVRRVLAQPRSGGRTERASVAGEVLMPASVVHRERTTPGTPGEIVLVRIGPGPVVVNVDDPHDPV